MVADEEILDAEDVAELAPIIFEPTPKQREAHAIVKKYTIVLYGGAIRGGKSIWGILEIISLCFVFKNSRWLMLRESRVTIEATLLVTFKENFLNRGLQQYVDTFPQDSLVLTWNNGSQIIFMGENYAQDKDLNRFRGLEINGAFIDEVNETQQVTYNKVVERAGTWFHAEPLIIKKTIKVNGVDTEVEISRVTCPTRVLMSCNPTQNWVKKEFHDRWKDGTLPEGVAYIPAKITDNPHVPKEFLDKLKLLPRYQYEVFVNGDWEIAIKTGGEFYKCFELDQHVKPESVVKYDPLLPLHVSWDENVHPYLPCGVFQIRPRMETLPGGKTRIIGWYVDMIDEIAGETPNNTTAAVCRELIRRYPDHSTGMFIYGDATADKEDVKQEKGYTFYRLIIDALKDFKPTSRVAKSNPPVYMRGLWINTVLETEYGGLIIRISEKCKKAVNDFVLLKEDADGGKLKEMAQNPDTKARYQKYGHFTDLFDYFLCGAFGQKFAEYQKGSVVSSIQYGKNIRKKHRA